MQLTPNRRLAIYLTEQRSTKQGSREQGTTRQGSQTVYFFSQWLEKLWQDYPGKKPLLLSSIEQQILWERIISQSREDYPLLCGASTAKMAMEAWNICHQWEIPMDTTDWQREDHQVFLAWAKAFEAECERHGWIDISRLLPWLMTALERGGLQGLSLPSFIECVGFQEWDPQQTRFLDLCRQRGVEVKQSSLLRQKGEKGEVFQLAASSPRQELESAIQMAGQVLKNNQSEQSTQTGRNSASLRFGIVVPDLEQRRFEVLRLLEAQFKPNQFNVSAPLSLSSYPLIEAALLGLSIFKKELSFEEWSRFLRLPFFGKGVSVSEMSYRAQLDVLFRERPRPSFCSLESFSSIVESIVKSLLKKLPSLVNFQWPNLLRDCLSLRFVLQGRRTTEEWAVLFKQILNTLQWPGERTLTSLEYQLKNQWDEILLEYQRLGHLFGKHRYEEAVYELQRLCVAKKFLPQSEQAPVQVLGLLEGLGLPFDYLWVVGLSREVWPKEPAPHPFIPLNLQRSLGVPRSSPKRELQVALQMTEQLSCAASTVIFSYPQQIDDSKMAISALLADLPSMEAEKLQSYLNPNLNSGLDLDLNLDLNSRLGSKVHSDSHTKTNLQQTHFEGIDLFKTVDLFKDDQALMMGSEVAAVVEQQAGESLVQGSRFLKLQSVCPFRAFAELRLKARPLGSEQWGLNAAERGEILHQILHLFWRGLDSQVVLKALSDVKREGRLYWAVDMVFNQWKRDHRYRLQPRYFSIEQQRALRLVRQFIELDLLRSPFTVVGHEIEQSVVLGGISLKLRIDRIDRLETGEELLIDYKTGKVNVAEWFGERPLDPQLPLYCIAREPSPAGVAFALIRSDQICYQGLAEKSEDLPGVLSPLQMKRYGCEESLGAQIGVWRARLSALADEFMLGRADVAPLQGQQTCRSCHLQALCRYQA